MSWDIVDHVDLDDYCLSLDQLNGNGVTFVEDIHDNFRALAWNITEKNKTQYFPGNDLISNSPGPSPSSGSKSMSNSPGPSHASGNNSISKTPGPSHPGNDLVLKPIEPPPLQLIRRISFSGKILVPTRGVRAETSLARGLESKRRAGSSTGEVSQEKPSSKESVTTQNSSKESVTTPNSSSSATDNLGTPTPIDNQDKKEKRNKRKSDPRGPRMPTPPLPDGPTRDMRDRVDRLLRNDPYTVVGNETVRYVHAVTTVTKKGGETKQYRNSRVLMTSSRIVSEAYAQAMAREQPKMPTENIVKALQQKEPVDGNWDKDLGYGNHTFVNDEKADNPQAKKGKTGYGTESYFQDFKFLQGKKEVHKYFSYHKSPQSSEASSSTTKKSYADELPVSLDSSDSD